MLMMMSMMVMFDLFSEFRIESKAYEYQYATKPLTARHRIVKDDHRAENCEEFSSCRYY